MDSRINRRKNKIGIVAWPKRCNAMPRRRGSPRRGFLRLGRSENSKNSASDSLGRRDLRLGGALRLGVGVSCWKHK